MKFLFSYRYLMIAMTSLGNILFMCLRSAFPMVVTHTTKRNMTEPGPGSFYPHCTSYNTSSDYISGYSQDKGMMFHAVFYFASFIAVVICGHFTTRFPSHIILGLGLFLSSLLFCALPFVFQISFTGVLLIRFLQGFLDAVTQPCAIILVTSWAKKSERSSFLTLSLLGQFLSPAITNITVGACLCYISWDSAFYIYGAAGIIWSLLWAKMAYPLPRECPFISKEEMAQLPSVQANLEKGSKNLASNIPWKGILTSKAVWAIWVCGFNKSVVGSIILTIQPLFFLDVFGLRAADSGLILSLPFVLNAAGAFFFSFIADSLIASKRLSPIWVRKLMQCVGAFFEAMFLVLMIYATTWQMSYLFLLIAYTFDGMTFAGYKCNVMDLSLQYSGVVMAVVKSGGCGAFSVTLIASLVAGEEASHEKWSIVFWLESLVAALAAVVFYFFATSDRQSWDGQTETEYALIPNSECDDEDKTSVEKCSD